MIERDILKRFLYLMEFFYDGGKLFYCKRVARACRTRLD